MSLRLPPEGSEIGYYGHRIGDQLTHNVYGTGRLKGVASARGTAVFIADFETHGVVPANIDDVVFVKDI